GRTLAGIGEHFVGLVGLLEFLFRRLVVRIAVGVVFHRQAAIGLLQLCLAGAALNPEHFVIITFGHKSSTPLIRRLQTRQRGSKPPRGESPTAKRPAGTLVSGAYLLSLTSSNSASTTSSPASLAPPSLP